MPRLEVQKIKKVLHSELPDLARGPVTIGRSSQSHIILADTHVSRNHCVIELIEGVPHIRDLKSHGGTFVNGKRIESAALAEGDVIRVGPFEIVFGERRQQPLLIAHADDEREALLNDRESDLAAREAALAARAAELDQHHAAGQENARALASLQQELQSQGQQHESLASSLRQQIDDLTSDLEERNAEVSRLTQTLVAAREQLQGKGQEIEQLHAHECALQQRVDELEQLRIAALDQAEQAARGFRILADHIEALREAAQQVESFQTRVELIEAAWVELDERLELAGDDDQLLEQAALQRHAMSTQLGETTEQRDEAVAILHEAARQVIQAAARHQPVASSPSHLQGLEIVTAKRSRTLAGKQTAAAQGSGKRWRLWGR